jgi:CTP:molybdopterin cytidylyltransferase MocA
MSNVAAVVLAAGMSQRMGRLKPLLPFGDKPMIARVVQTLQSAGDQPAVRSSTLIALRRTWQQRRAPVVLPIHNERRGHPVLFDRSCAGEILALPHDATLKTVVQAHAAQILEVAVVDEGVLHDVDTPEEYERALQTWRRENEEPQAG